MRLLCLLDEGKANAPSLHVPLRIRVWLLGRYADWAGSPEKKSVGLHSILRIPHRLEYLLKYMERDALRPDVRVPLWLMMVTIRCLD